MNKFRYSITSHASPTFGEPGRRIYDVTATDVETGLRYPLGCTSDKGDAKAIRDAHKAKVAAGGDSQPTLQAGQTVYLIENGRVVERKVEVAIKYSSHSPFGLFSTHRAASIALARRLRSQAATLISQAEELEAVQ